MTAAVLAHQGGWDELLLVAGPIALFVVLLAVANRRARRQEAEQQEAEHEAEQHEAEREAAQHEAEEQEAEQPGETLQQHPREAGPAPG